MRAGGSAFQHAFFELTPVPPLLLPRLAVEDGLIASGSETNEVYIYTTRLPRPLACQAIQTPLPAAPSGAAGGRPAAPQPFVSAVAWRPGAEHLLAANSAGAIQLMRVVSSD